MTKNVLKKNTISDEEIWKCKFLLSLKNFSKIQI